MRLFVRMIMVGAVVALLTAFSGGDHSRLDAGPDIDSASETLVNASQIGVQAHCSDDTKHADCLISAILPGDGAKAMRNAWDAAQSDREMIFGATIPLLELPPPRT